MKKDLPDNVKVHFLWQCPFLDTFHTCTEISGHLEERWKICIAKLQYGSEETFETRTIFCDY